MKKVLLSFSLCLYGMTILNANSTVEMAVDCDEFAYAATAVVEDHFGCLDSDTYNAVYTGHLNSCKEITGQ